MSKIAILGSGGWGTALAVMAAGQGHQVILWSPFESEIETLKNDREHKKLLPGIKIPENIELTADIARADGCELIIIATPSFAVGETARRLAGVLNGPHIIANVSKGIEKETFLRLSEVISRELPDCRVVALSGPSHAEEVAVGIPTTIVSASPDMDAAATVQDILMNSTFRIYTNPDIIGVELGGALKNIIALAAGVSDGLGLGDNTKASLITRGLSEIAELGVAMGARKDTFAGLSGIGDLVVTCTSQHSRNRRFGLLIGQMVSVEDAVEKVGMTVEGYHAANTAYFLRERHNVQMPIVEQVYNVLYKGDSPKEAIKRLMGRPKRNESEHVYFDLK